MDSPQATSASALAYGHPRAGLRPAVALLTLHGTDNGTDIPLDEQGENMMPPLQAARE